MRRLLAPRAVLLSATGLLLSSTAQAATTSVQSTTVDMVILNQCEISGSPGGGAAALLDWGTYDALSTGTKGAATPSSGSGAITVTCNAATSAATVAFSLGQNANGATRQLASGSNRIAYQLYQDAGFSQPIGTSAISLGAFSSGQSATMRVYGRLPAFSAGNIPAGGQYTDQLTMTLSF
ncbi:Csu type fimbrial protein [Sphingomonas parapaucimobilis]|uniref:Csu type fimbrial protein n=1 Tax=Sphingomonas parapaucimobilis TaxID=28213 RepID=UPI00321A0F5C